MASYEFSVLAEEDLNGIYVYTYKRFGPEQADSYNELLIRCVERIAETPAIGRTTENITANYLRYNCQSHAIFYEVLDDGVLIIRVLHQRMDFKRHLRGED